MLFMTVIFASYISFVWYCIQWCVDVLYLYCCILSLKCYCCACLCSWNIDYLPLCVCCCVFVLTVILLMPLIHSDSEKVHFMSVDLHDLYIVQFDGVLSLSLNLVSSCWCFSVLELRDLNVTGICHVFTTFVQLKLYPRL